jgi:hypothetical protein
LHAYNEGIKLGIFLPEYHGREHINYLRWMRGLQEGDKGLMEPFKLSSIGFNRVGGKPIREHLAAYDPEFEEDKPFLEKSLKEGASLFKDLFGYRPNYFVASKNSEPKSFEKILASSGVKYLMRYKLHRYPLGAGKFEHELNWLGKRNKHSQLAITRNGGFEPANENIKWLDRCFFDIKNAFYFGKPAIISTHRVSYVGRLSVRNRDNGLVMLKKLLDKIVAQWPDVEFMSSKELGDIIKESKS